MAYQCILEGIIASLFAFVLFYNLTKGKKNNKRSRDECVKSSQNGECRPEVAGATDVIIVGAGVAGAALAHTLAKKSSNGVGGYVLDWLGLREWINWNLSKVNRTRAELHWLMAWTNVCGLQIIWKQGHWKMLVETDSQAAIDFTYGGATPL
ncbi:hypothetical protein L1049_015129 [Liquidambar formosana]|uniref:Squalene monooxygenase n=1 Tax=Liquidambar formosana TaxID=63359 RepID=A0AAP0S363_LIQFO